MNVRGWVGILGGVLALVACGEEADSGGAGASGGAGGAGSGGASESQGGASGETGSGGASGGSGGAQPSTCPYTTSHFSCPEACANLKAIASKCQDDPSLSSETKTLLAGAATGMGNACKAACAADSPNFPEQWRCFQGVPVAADCTAIAGCTTVNCP